MFVRTILIQVAFPPGKRALGGRNDIRLRLWGYSKKERGVARRHFGMADRIILGEPGGIIFWTGLMVRRWLGYLWTTEKNVQMPHSAASG